VPLSAHRYKVPPASVNCEIAHATRRKTALRPWPVADDHILDPRLSPASKPAPHLTEGGCSDRDVSGRRAGFAPSSACTGSRLPSIATLFPAGVARPPCESPSRASRSRPALSTDTTAALTEPNLRRPSGQPERTFARRGSWCTTLAVRHWRRSANEWFESPPLRPIHSLWRGLSCLPSWRATSQPTGSCRSRSA
jgi:hypothetical protein